MFFVRTASDQDLPVIRDVLVDTLHATYDPVYGVETVTDVIENHCTLEQLSGQRHEPNSEFLVADNGEVVGGMAYASQEDRIINLHQLYVHPKYHGGKTGLHLMIEIENSFIDADLIRLEVEESNEKAVGFFKAFGFEPVREVSSSGIYGAGVSMLVMEKSVIYAQD